MWGSLAPLHVSQTLEKKMDKKFYEMPEVEVIDLELEGALLSDSDPISDGPAPQDPTPGGADEF